MAVSLESLSLVWPSKQRHRGQVIPEGGSAMSSRGWCVVWEEASAFGKGSAPAEVREREAANENATYTDITPMSRASQVTQW